MPLTVGTDCSGMEAPLQALMNLGVNFSHKFSCDVDSHARATINANFPPEKMYDDITTRDNESTPSVQLYVAGFPCQPFSSAGLQQGFKDTRGRGKIFFDVARYLEEHTPEIFILENVSGMKRLENGKYFKQIMSALNVLKNPGYNITDAVLDTKEHGVPHSRRRIYIVGIRKDKDKKTFEFPEALPAEPVDRFLDPLKPEERRLALPPKSQGTARANVIHHNKELRAAGVNPQKTTYIMDVDSSSERSKAVKGRSPCITCSRRSGHWVSTRNRRQTLEEMLRMQAMNPTILKMAVSRAQLGKQIGNAMSVNVLERLLVKALPAAGLVSSRQLEDRWETGKAQTQLAKTCGKKIKEVPRPEDKISSQSGWKSIQGKRAASGSSSASPTKRRKTA